MLTHNYIGTEHELLALLREGEGIAAQALAGLGVTLEEVRRQVVKIVGMGEATPPSDVPSSPLLGDVPLSPWAKKVFELAVRQSLELGHNYVDTGHILLGMVRERDGLGAQILRRFGADRPRVWQTVIGLLPDPSGGAGRLPVPEGSGWEALTRGSPNCPSCALSLQGMLRYEALGMLSYERLVVTPLDDHFEPVAITLFCARCGALLGNFRMGAEPPDPGRSVAVREDRPGGAGPH
jgi:Clp amino terminal domain, pathogenicity island component